MKYRIIKDYYRDTGNEFFYVEEKGWFFWGTPKAECLYRLRFTSCGVYFAPEHFKTEIEAVVAIMKAKEIAGKHAQITHYI